MNYYKMNNKKTYIYIYIVNIDRNLSFHNYKLINCHVFMLGISKFLIHHTGTDQISNFFKHTNE